mmetsp:Transcript_5111/g.8367  ORF Transcript_5111/g.8367 Transcript_5111/m.8367 type:complete len:287 (-) Transcript_5111:1018-1878(-)|eukprot:CAMPEP_0114434774 /NCGR_PEP_ID=MMETSP0103-20121206/12453_1 /TAXON_ID=37642 ORGANISM="Paraphysomonas imperforata, Strain PA2" /NCGR_SAMPLE_ID=MMETSP0103 /ASSEMBLY_ACC=CAM_ASM_000201 /LENGTH=286 /DNA_ID=CAMNT_0001604709 /DNA_START=99 /DNA_END=959 /DNA_ORIENTATION=-
MSENIEKEKNREKTLKRSRMWQVVGDDDDNDDDASSSSGSDSESDGSDSSSEHDRKHKKHKKSDKKSKKHKKDKKEKKSSKDKKHKKDKKKDRKKDKHKHAKTAVDQNEYGKYGIIKEEHYFQKQREFEAYIFEVKKLPGLFGQGKAEIAEYFRTFVEDYNTATMPSEKYYDIARWEMQEYQNAQKKKARKRIDEGDVPVVFDDEAAVAQERRLARARREQKEFKETLSKMSTDKGRVQDMRRQSELQGELQQAYKRGDMVTVRRLEKLLTPDEEPVGGGVKHPWA